MDNFPPQPPASSGAFSTAIQQAIQAILTALNSAGNTFDDLVGAVQAIVTTVENVSVLDLFGTSDDDKARNVVNSMSGEGLLAVLPSGAGAYLHSLAAVRLLLALARRPTNVAPVGCTRCHIGQMRLFALCTLRGAFRAGRPLLDSS
jgi:hypothetical protein